ncbi:potassium channel family protein [Endozoicomonas arenosclerae]|uniref:potassium channel family protein n=1 Tax=Endozoicomonas arenosclerae TaxID=1633495 RepID=UPI0015605601|nr:potassium channel family protein [Endozoicomonas arenosclerae]
MSPEMSRFSNNQLLSGLLLTLLVSVLVPVSVEDNTIGGQIFSLLIIASLMTVLARLTEKRMKVRRWLQATGFTLLGIRILISLGHTPGWADTASLLLVILFQMALMVLLMGHLFSDETLDEKLLAAINFYFLTGITFGFIYTLLNLILPGAFDFPSHGAYDWPDFIYFSFINLTTLGYGDITPVASIAKSLVVIEAAIGVLSPTIMISRFVRPAI